MDTMSTTFGRMGDIVGYPKIIATAFALMNVSAPCIAYDAEITVLSSGALKLALTQLVADFQKSSGARAH